MNARTHARVLARTRTQTILKNGHAGGGGSEKEDGHHWEKARQAAEKVAEERMDDGERRASSRKPKAVQRFVEEEEGRPRKRSKPVAAATGHDEKAGLMDIGRLSPEQAPYESTNNCKPPDSEALIRRRSPLVRRRLNCRNTKPPARH